MIIQAQGETLELLPERALYWAKESALIFSDVHLGKSESLQFHGVAMPSGTHFEDLDRMHALLNKYQAKQVFILGDWIHQRTSWSENLVRDLHGFFELHPNVKWTFVMGNHEKGSLKYLRQFPFEIVEEEIRYGPFLLAHGHHAPAADVFQIQGHLHPIVVLKQGPTRMRLPCFVLQKQNLVLPSFGSLTGGREMELQTGDRVFAVAPDGVFEVRPRGNQITY